MNQYQYERSNPLRWKDPSGKVTFEQINLIAQQVGTASVKQDYSNATQAITALQKALGMPDPDGEFGPRSVAFYEEWAIAHNMTPVALRDSKTSKEVFDMIVKHWPAEHPAAETCPIGLGEFLGIIFFESMDTSTSTRAKGATYFNAIGGPFSTSVKDREGKKRRTTAVGLAQFVKDKAPREIAYDAEKSIQRALKIMMDEAVKEKDGTYNFTPGKYKSLNEWEAWKSYYRRITEIGQRISYLLEYEYGGDPSCLTEENLDEILGIRCHPDSELRKREENALRAYPNNPVQRNVMTAQTK